MNDAIAWRYLCLNWCLIGALLAATLIAATASGFQLKVTDASLYLRGGLAGLVGLPSFALLRAGTARWPRMAHAAAAMSILITATIAFLPLSYVAASADLPLQDGNLYALDRLMG